ncbi:MAG: glycoside hydrolase family 78 protein [Lachnospiraceae bacterium]|nr:glycoside hydrolase family 78 protein [Lachnospiraceae bacterium]
MASIKKIMVNYLEQPTGIRGEIQLGWVLESDKRGAVQEKYQIRIAEDEDFETVVYDSGEVASSESTHIVVEEDWKDICRYYVKVKAVVSGEETEWTESGFITGYQNIDAWQGAFITAETPEDASNSAGTYLRKTFNVNGEVKRAWVVSSAHGIYRAYINGTKTGPDEFAPGWTSYNKRLLYQTWEITDLLCKGENVIGVHLGAGWYKGEMSFNHIRNIYGDRTAFGGQIILDYADGRREVIATDESWRGSKSPVLFSEIYDGEIYDARLEQDGWNLAGFDDGAWTPVCSVERDIHTLVPQNGCPVEEITRLDPIAVIETPGGDTVIDFGQNLTGWCYINVENVQPGDRVELNFFEILDAAGNVYTENLRSAKETIVYICRGGGKEVYHPHFTFQGFRYAKVASYPGEVRKENFTAWALHSAMRRTGDFSCSNSLIDQLQHNILWGMKGNFLDIPTDCPQRDERLGWTGDAQIFCRTASFLMDTYTFYSKWLQDVAADQTPEGSVPNVVPDVLSGHSDEDWLSKQGTDGSSAWADVAVINPWVLYLTYGDTAILERQYDSMSRWIAFMEEHSVEDCIYQYLLQYGDWVALDAEEGSYFGATPTEYTCSAYFCYSTGLMAKIAKILGKNEDVKRFDALYERLKASFAEHFFDENGKLTIQTQTAHVVALYFRLVPEEYIETTVKNLQKLLAAEDGHLVTGFIGTSYITHALSENKCLDEAYDLLLKEDFPSWLYQVKMGATTMWEHWDGLKPDGTMWSPDMNSFNHYAFGSIGEWLYRVVGGLEADEEAGGYRHFYVQPLIGGGLDYADLSYESIYGDIRIHWERSGDEVSLEAAVPIGTSADFVLRQAREVTDSDGLDVEEAVFGYRMSADAGIYRIQFSI